MPIKVNIITMGCSKNLVDSQTLCRLMQQRGLQVQLDDDSLHCDVLVVNTCGFIGDAKQESIDMILRCAEAKKRHWARRLYVMGCLSQRYAAELPAELPEVDGWYGKFDWRGLADRLAADFGAKPEATPQPAQPAAVTQYIKIAEGCNRFCAFCAIPLITGRFTSRPIDEIVAEVTDLAARGAREFNIIAQDLSAYGTDLYGSHRLADLVDRLAQIPGVQWIRLHYAYPTDFPMDVLDVMARHPNVCRYLDIALQHSSDAVLANMRRHITAAQQEELLAEIRRRVPGIHLRTTLMVGFPGETDAEFESLMTFVRRQRFERMGAFAYCEEEDTYAARHLHDEIPTEVKQQRLDRLMALQEQIAAEHSASKIGQTLRTLITGQDADNYIGRTEFDSPEVDPEVLIPKATAKAPLEVGKFYDIRITDADTFDLFGELAE